MEGRGSFSSPALHKRCCYQLVSGTADAVYQNLRFIRDHDPHLVLVLSGDHVYKMDYRNLIRFHQENKADLL
jgi:glucose-1-phosphate adenylyltransferase